MTEPESNPERSRRRGRPLSVATVALAAVLALGIASTAGGARSVLLGKTKSSPEPNCSADNSQECQITGQVTGFQQSADGRKGLFRVSQPGKIVAWSVHLASPSQEERDFFGEAAGTDEFGRAPTAGISVIRRKDKNTFKLIRATPILKVQRDYGSQPIYTLDHPLLMRKGDVAALTTPTWLPAFSIKGQTENDVWVASRPKKHCTIPPDIPPEEQVEWFFDHTKPHRKIGSERRYACSYDQARLLYWVWFVPKR